MDPYSVLGIEQTEDWSIIKQAYKKMASATHPDKMGHAKYFMMVHEAYQELEKYYGKKKKHKQREELEDIIVTSKHGQPCTNNKFNEYFEENKIEEMNPFSRGYRNYMTKSSVREDAADLSRHQVKKKEKRIIVRHEPEAAVSHRKWLDQVGLLGVEKIEDFTCQHGTDYMNAYQDPDQVQEKHKYYNSVEEMEYERSNMDYRMTDEERRRREEWEQEQRRIEYERKRAMKRNDEYVQHQYRSIHERLT